MEGDQEVWEQARRALQISRRLSLRVGKGGVEKRKTAASVQSFPASPELTQSMCRSRILAWHILRPCAR